MNYSDSSKTTPPSHARDSVDPIGPRVDHARLGAVAPRILNEVLSGVSDAVVVCDRRGVVQSLHGTAPELLPSVHIGGDVHRSLLGHLSGGPDVFHGVLDGVSLTARQRPLNGGRSAWYLRASESHRTGPPSAEFLSESARRLNASLQYERVVQHSVQIPVPEIATTCLHFTVEPGFGVGWSRWSASDTASTPASGHLRVSAADRLEWLAAVLSGDAPLTEPWPSDTADLLPESSTPPGAMVALPVHGSTGVIGAMLFVRAFGHAGFDDHDIGLLREYCDRVGAAVSAALLYRYQSRTAETLRASLIPLPLPRAHGVSLGSAYRCALGAELIGGDYYEVSASPEGIDFLLGDVCGKGVEAAALSGLVRQSLNALKLVERRPRALVEMLNQVLVDNANERFTTLALGQATHNGSGGLDVVLAGGGHLPALVLHADATVEEIAVPGMIVGAIPDAVFATTSFTLAPGDMLLLYSDGVTEARNDLPEREMFGEERLHALLADCAGMPAGAVAERIEQVVGDWLRDGVHDDIAILAIQADGTH
ncbi:PP2C family protein-serine/threonine phosphatase [Nocardiopsis ansamitocini]|uniref:Histidine kinase n=1 Tax=Nocardiopsis ansamitocini TaxID=1670832 RepID=A0A9W6PAQ0_9ACTN|nr:PP2C family protein-serine/threonine phosphatase [Nocardiopsis ansamitocini]GLU50078.1 histidine kinase [Nocardiopsis ansamitocini]